jgi:tetratricopeptide (TPR) repeat protein
MRTLNIRLLAILLVGAILTGIVGYGVHTLQVRRNAGSLLRQAHDAKDADRLNEAMEYLQRYVSLVPRGSGDALAELGLLQANAERYVPALRNLQGALRQLPDRTDVQRKLVDVAIALRMYSDARHHLESLLKRTPDNPDPELLELLARCQISEGKYKAAVDSLSKAIEAAPDRLESYALLAAVYEERLEEGALARTFLDQMVEQNSTKAKAFVIRGTYRMEHLTTSQATSTFGQDEINKPAVTLEATAQTQQSLAAALQDAQAALELEPDNEGVILFATRCFLANRQPDEARTHVEHGKDLFPTNPAMFALLANVELQTNHREAAIDWLEQGLKVAPKSKRQDLLWNLCNLSLDANSLDSEQVKAVNSRLEELRKSKYPNPPLEYLNARLLTLQKPRLWLEASVKLEKNRAELVRWPDLLKQSDYLLGRCYEGLGNSDLQLMAYRRAASVDPLWVPARLGVAGALFTMGNVDEALREYAEIVKITDSLGVWLQMSRVMILANLRKKPDDRDWETVIRLLDQLEEFSPNSSEVAILKAEVLLAQDKATSAIELLQAARDRSPQDLELWLGLAAIAEQRISAEQRTDWSEALLILDEAQAKNGDSVPLRLARARLLINRGEPTARDDVLKLATPGPEFKQEQTLQLYAGMAGMLFVLKDFDETARLCKLVAKERSSDLLVRLLLFDTAIRAGEDKESDRRWDTSKRLSIMTDTLQEMLEIGGKSPLWHYGMAVQLRIMADEAQRKIDNPTSATDKVKNTEIRSKCFRDARQHLALAGASRRNWSRVPLLLADINMAQGDEQAALENYLEAIKRGEQSPAILSQVVILLNQQGKLEEADKFIRRLDQQVRSPFSNDMIRLATEISLKLSDQNRALELTTNRFRPKDAGEFMWAGQVFAILGKLIDAEQSFRKAIEFDETQAEPWVALIQFLGRTQQLEKASADFEQAEKKINQNEVAGALARCIEFTGKGFEEMEARYQSTLSASPDDVTAIRRMIDFYMRQQKQRKAEPLLQQIVSGESNASPDDKSWARRNLALALTSHPDRASMKRALALLDETLKSDAASDTDRRTKAMVLATFREREPRLEAIGLLEQLLKVSSSQDTPESAEDRFVLAQLYFAVGDGTKVATHMRSLLATHGDVRSYVEFYAKYLLTRGEVDESEKWLQGLENADKSQQQDVYSKISFSVEALFVREKYDELLSAVDGFVADPAIDQAERRLRIRRTATLLESYAERLKRGGQVGAKPSETTTALSVRFVNKSEELFRRNAQENPPEALALAAYCSRHGQLDEALAILERSWSTAQPGEITPVAIALMISPAATPQQLTGVEKILRSAIEQQNRNILLVQALADLQSWREEYDEAETLYRESLSKGYHPLALNNLALMLALLGKGGNEPLKLIEKAIELVGLDPSLLDSRATINLALGNPQLAAPDLILAIEKRPSPLSYFHQAQVFLRLGQKDSARKSMETANEVGLQIENLHPLERKNYRQLQQELRN